MNITRGILMLGAGVFVIWRGFVAHGHWSPWAFYGVGALAIALGVFHLVSKPPKRRM